VLEDAVERQKNNGDGCCDRVGYRVTDAPSCLVSVMRSCRCSAAFCLFALSFAKPHDDRRGPPWPSRVQPASLLQLTSAQLIVHSKASFRCSRPAYPRYPTLACRGGRPTERRRIHVAILMHTHQMNPASVIKGSMVRIAGLTKPGVKMDDVFKRCCNKAISKEIIRL
jgi:hypothetical protein